MDVRSATLACALAATVLAVPAGAQNAGRLTRESLNSAGEESNGQAGAAALSADGRYLAFQSDASDLVPGDNNQHTDVFVRDRTTGVVQRVSLTWNGMEARGDSECPALSADGRYVAFRSSAWNINPGSTNVGTARYNVYVYDRQGGSTTRVSVSSSGGDPDGDSFCPSISGDGQKVVFSSVAKNLIAGRVTVFRDVYLRDRTKNETTVLTEGFGGGLASSDSNEPAISRDGRFVAFHSNAINLVPPNASSSDLARTGPHVYVRDLEAGTTERVSVALREPREVPNEFSASPSISDDGRYVAFRSRATNLIDDTPRDWEHVFVRDRVAGTTWLASPIDPRQTDCGREGDHFSCAFGLRGPPAISGDGRFVTFSSRSLFHLPANESHGDQIYLFDNVGRRLRRLSVDPTGVPGDACSWQPDLSRDGTVVAYASKSTNLVPDGSEKNVDVFAQTWSCDDDGVCRTLAACPAEPAECDEARSSVLRLRKRPPGGVNQDDLFWRWTGSASSRPFPDPNGSARYQFCMYAQDLSLDLGTPASACDGKGTPCWRPFGKGGYHLVDATGGLTVLTLSSTTGARRILAHGSGELLDAPYLPLSSRRGIVMQLHEADSGQCWGASFPATGIVRNYGGVATAGSRHDGQLVAQVPVPQRRLAH